GSLLNDRASLARLTARYRGALAVMEAGAHSPWVSRYLEGLGWEVIVSNPRKVRAIYQQERKSDQRDALMLARIGRMDRALLYPVRHGSVQTLAELSMRIAVLEREINVLARTKYPQTLWLQQVPGVGALTALYFVLKIEDPQRFENVRDVGAYAGLCPRRDQSGQSDPQLRISKRGDPYLRRLLVSAAQYILGPFGPQSALRAYGLMLATDGSAR